MTKFWDNFKEKGTSFTNFKLKAFNSSFPVPKKQLSLFPKVLRSDRIDEVNVFPSVTAAQPRYAASYDFKFYEEDQLNAPQDDDGDPLLKISQRSADVRERPESMFIVDKI